jgi:hypothetical protein
VAADSFSFLNEKASRFSPSKSFPLPPRCPKGGYQIDKNSLWGGLNIKKGELSVKGILAQDPLFVGGRFSGVSGGFGVEVERELSTIPHHQLFGLYEDKNL